MGRAAVGLLLVVLIPAVLPFAGADAPTERALVSFEDAVPSSGSLVGSARVLEAFPFARVALVEGAPAALHRLALLPGIAGVYPEEPIALSMDRVRALVHAEAPASDASWPRGGSVTVALVDSGIDAKHPDLDGRVRELVRVSASGAIVEGDGDADGHGTHVAGILAASGASSGGRLRGLAPEAGLVGVDISGSFTTTSAVRAFAWIHEHREEHGIRVVSNSWGREKADARYDEDDPVVRASDALVADGLVVVFSAGNRGREGAATLTTEAMNPHVLAVGSASGQGRRESYSSQGPAQDTGDRALPWTKPDLMAPGSQVTSLRAGGGHVVMNGTSMAAPQVAAAAALLLDAHPELPPHTVAAILQGTARDLGAAGPDDETGHGMLDVAAALEAARLMQQGDERVVTESRVPVRLAGSLLGAAGRVLATGGSPHLPPEESVVLPLVVPDGARSLELAFNWSGTGEVEVHLRGRGEARPFAHAGASKLRFEGEVLPGTYSIVVTPKGAATNAPFTVQGSILVVDERVVDLPQMFTGRPFVAQGGFFLPRDPTARALEAVGKAPLLTFALCAFVSCAVGLRWRAAAKLSRAA